MILRADNEIADLCVGSRDDEGASDSSPSDDDESDCGIADYEDSADLSDVVCAICEECTGDRRY